MSIKSAVKYHEDNQNAGEMTPAFIDETNAIWNEFQKVSTEASKLITEKMLEKDFVILSRLIEKTVVYALEMQGRYSVVAAHETGDLEKYTHSVVLAMIGMLIADDIL